MESDTLAKGIPLEESLALTRALLFKHHLIQFAKNPVPAILKDGQQYPGFVPTNPVAVNSPVTFRIRPF